MCICVYIYIALSLYLSLSLCVPTVLHTIHNSLNHIFSKSSAQVPRPWQGQPRERGDLQSSSISRWDVPPRKTIQRAWG